jgi:hypothetical protein
LGIKVLVFFHNERNGEIMAYNLAGNTNQPSEDPRTRAVASNTGILKQIFDAIESLGSDVIKAVGFDRPNQDRGSASATPDVLKINAQNTPPAAMDYWGPDNPEIKYSHQKNGGPEFRFVGIQQWQPNPQGGNRNLPVLIAGMPLGVHSNLMVERFPTLRGLTTRGSVSPVMAGTFTVQGVDGKKILTDAAASASPSGASAASAPSAPSGGGSSSRGRISYTL